MISERKLKKWRRIALLTKARVEHSEHTKMLASFILELTQELLDQRLMSKNKEEGKNAKT